MKRLLKVLVLICGLCCASLHAENEAELPQIQITMREHGYHLGDLLVQKIMIKHAQTQHVDMKSLPLPGPVKSWLDLKEVEVTPVKDGTEITLVWQLFATVEAAQQLPLPPWTITLTGSPSVQLKIESVPFYQSPIFSSNVSQVERKATLTPLMYDLTPWQSLAVIGLIICALFASAALWVQDKLPFLPFRPGPLCQAQRAIVKTKSMTDGERLTVLYRQLCLLASTTLHRHNLAQLFTRAPYLIAFQQEIETFVSHYSDLKFGYQPLLGEALSQTVNEAAILSQVSAWLPAAALLERSTRKRPLK